MWRHPNDPPVEAPSAIQSATDGDPSRAPEETDAINALRERLQPSVSKNTEPLPTEFLTQAQLEARRSTLEALVAQKVEPQGLLVSKAADGSPLSEFNTDASKPTLVPRSRAEYWNGPRDALDNAMRMSGALLSPTEIEQLISENDPSQREYLNFDLHFTAKEKCDHILVADYSTGTLMLFCKCTRPITTSGSACSALNTNL